MADANLIYNGIPLANLYTQRVSQSAELDESKTDQLYTRLRISVISIFNPDTVPAIDVEDGVVVRRETPSETMKRVRHMLLVPRRSLHFNPAGGENFIAVSPPDDANGPFPVSCDIRQITPETWEIEYTIDVALRDCDAGSGERQWLSLRWSDVLTYNENWFATRKRTGVLVLSSFGFTPDPEKFRGLVTPEVPQGFRRTSAEYSLSENNLKVRFTFIDVQLNEVPPLPAVKLTGRMIVSTPIVGGLRKGELHLRLTGPKGVRKQELVAVAVRAGMSRVSATSVVGGDRGKILVGGSVAEILDDDTNAVELTLSWNIKLDAARSGKFETGKPILLGGGFGWVGQPLSGSDPKRAIGPPTRGTADAVRLVAAVLNDPCGQDPAQVETATANSGTPADPQADSPTLRIVSSGSASALGPEQMLLSDMGGLYADDGPGVYEDYAITSHYSDDPGLEVAPSTKPGGLAKALQFHAGIKRLCVEFTATKSGGPPTIPDPEPQDPNVIYLGGTISPAGTDLASDSTEARYTVSGVLNYAFLDGSKVIVAAPLPPWISRSLALGAGQAAARLGQDIAFPSKQGADPFEGTGTIEVLPSGGEGAGGDWGPITGDGNGQRIYP